MNWIDEGFLISKNRYSENSLITELFTKNHGKTKGIIFGGVVLLGKINLNEKKPTDEANIVMPMPVTCCDAPR